MTKLGTAFFEVLPDTNAFTKQLKGKVDAAIASVGISPAAAALGVGLGAAIVGGLGIAAATASKFEKGLSAVRSVAGATEEQMEAVRAKALQLGADTAFSATQAAGAMEELVKAGLSVEQVLGGAADAAVSLAAAGGVSLETAATIASNALNSFSLGGDQISKVADIVAGAANASAIGVSDFALSLSQAGAVANLAGLSFGDTATAIALMGNAGIRGSDAGTSLKTMLQNLIPVTAREKNLFSELGIVTEEAGNRFFDATGRVKSLAEISAVLQDATRGQTEQQKLYNLSILFGSDALRAAGILTKAGADGVRELNAEMRETTAAEAAAIRMDNLAGSFEQFKGSLETVLITVGTPLQSGLRSVLDFGTRTLNVFGDLGAGSGLVADTFGDLVDVGRDVARLLGNVADAAAPAVAVLAKLGGGAVVVGLNALADVLGPLARLLAENEVAANLLAGVLVTKLVASAYALTYGLRFTVAVLGVAAVQMGATAAAAVALHGPLTAAGLAATSLFHALSPALLVGAGFAAVGVGLVSVISAMNETKAAAKETYAELVGDKLKSNNLDVLRDGAAAAADESRRLQQELGKEGPRALQFLKGTAQNVLPGVSNTIQRLQRDTDAAADAAVDLSRRFVPLRENAKKVADVTGLTSEQVVRLADKLKVDLAGEFTPNAGKVIEAALSMSDALKVTGGSAEKAVALTEAQAEASEKLAEAIAKSFESATTVIGQFKSKLDVGSDLVGFLKEQADAAKDSEAGSRAVAGAQRTQADAQRQLNAALAGGDAAKIAREQDQLAGANERLAAAQEKAATSGRSAGGPLAFLRTQLAEARGFQDGLAKIIAAGIDPTLVRELAEQGPKVAGAAVQGILAEVRAGNTEAVNETARALREAQNATKGQSLAFFREQVAEQQAFLANIRELIKAGLDPTLIRDLATSQDFGSAAALLADVRAGNLELINQSQADLRTLRVGLIAEVDAATGPLVEATRRAGELAMKGLPQGMADALAGVKSSLLNILTGDGEGSILSNLRAAAGGLGVAFKSGIAAGFGKGDSGIGTAAKGVVDSTVKTTKEHAGIRSPSRLFADEVGGPIVAGIALGMREQMASVVAQAESIVAQAARVTVPTFDVPSLAGAVPAGGVTGAAGATPVTGALTRTGPMIEFTVDARGSQDPDEIAEAIDRKLGWRAANAAYEMPSS